MRHKMFWAIIALAAVAVTGSGPAWAITGGEPDGNRHPNVGTVIAYHPAYGRIIPWGSGTLVHERVMLTAGHIVAPILSGEVTLLGVSFDPVADLTNPSSWLKVSNALCSNSPNGSGRRSANPNQADIGVLILDQPVMTIRPAPLPRAGLLDDLKRAGQLNAGKQGTDFTVVGYGFSLDWPPPQPIPPNSGDGQIVRKVAQSGYRGLNDAWLHTSQNLAVGFGGTAAGDSGGPAFWNNPETGEDVLVGITSWGDPNWVAMNFYYRIDTEESLKFIQDAIDGLSAW